MTLEEEESGSHHAMHGQTHYSKALLLLTAIIKNTSTSLCCLEKRTWLYIQLYTQYVEYPMSDT